MHKEAHHIQAKNMKLNLFYHCNEKNFADNCKDNNHETKNFAIARNYEICN